MNWNKQFTIIQYHVHETGSMHIYIYIYIYIPESVLSPSWVRPESVLCPSVSVRPSVCVRCPGVRRCASAGYVRRVLFIWVIYLSYLSELLIWGLETNFINACNNTYLGPPIGGPRRLWRRNLIELKVQLNHTISFNIILL